MAKLPPDVSSPSDRVTTQPVTRRVEGTPTTSSRSGTTDWLNGVLGPILGRQRPAAARQLACAADRATIPLTYGSDRVGALILNVVTSGNNVLVQCLWGHACDSVNDLLYNDVALPAGASSNNYDGTQVAVDSGLASAFSAVGITYSETLNGYAYSVVTIPKTAFSGSLSFSARIRGRKVYDPRTGLTVWSDNPALCLRDFLVNTTYGCGDTVEDSTVTTVANANDALVGGTEKRRILSGISFISPSTASDTAEILRAYAGCFITQGANGIKLIVDGVRATDRTYAHASGQIERIVKLEKKDAAATPTVVEVVYTDASAVPYRDASVVVSAAGAGSTIPWRVSTIALPGIQRYSQAKREATERLNKLRTSDLAVTLDVFDTGIRHEHGDVIEVTHPVGLSSKKLRIGAIEAAGNGSWRLTCAEYDPAAYSDEVASGPTYPDTKPGNPAQPGLNVIGYLMSEAAALAADSGGTILGGILPADLTTMKVSVNGTDDSANWSYSRTNGSGVTSTVGAATGILNVTAMSVDTSYVDITATRTGYSSITKRFDLAKARAGTNGTNGTNGTPGQRGSQWFYISGRTSWSDSVADSHITGLGLTKVHRDTVTQYGTNFAQTRYWDGATWVQVAVAIDGNLLVLGSADVAALKAGTLLNQLTVGYGPSAWSGYSIVATGGKGYPGDTVSGIVMGKDGSGNSYFEVQAGTGAQKALLSMTSWGSHTLSWGNGKFAVDSSGNITAATITASNVIITDNIVLGDVGTGSGTSEETNTHYNSTGTYLVQDTTDNYVTSPQRSYSRWQHLMGVGTVYVDLDNGDFNYPDGLPVTIITEVALFDGFNSTSIGQPIVDIRTAFADYDTDNTIDIPFCISFLLNTSARFDLKLYIAVTCKGGPFNTSSNANWIKKVVSKSRVGYIELKR